jgi:hypothetical protein
MSCFDRSLPEGQRRGTSVEVVYRATGEPRCRRDVRQVFSPIAKAIGTEKLGCVPPVAGFLSWRKLGSAPSVPDLIFSPNGVQR